MPLLGLVPEAHPPPDERFVDPVTLHYLGINISVTRASVCPSWPITQQVEETPGLATAAEA